MSRDRGHLNLSGINVLGAVGFAVGFILTAVLLPAYLAGLTSPLVILLPVSLSVAGGILFVITNSAAENV